MDNNLVSPANAKSDASLDELRQLVDMALNNCTPEHTPAVCAMCVTAAGRAQVHESVMRYCLTGLAPGPAMVELEREYTFTTLD